MKIQTTHANLNSEAKGVFRSRLKSREIVRNGKILGCIVGCVKKNDNFSAVQIDWLN